jgi:FMN reductase
MSVVAVSAGDGPTSKTRALAAAGLELAGGGTLVDLATLPADGLLGRGDDAAVAEAVAAVGAADLVLLATPVYRATYSGVLKAFLDRFATGALDGVAVVLAATAGSPHHFLSLDTGGRSVVASLGGWTVPTVVYGTSADFVDGRPGPSLSSTLAAALDEAKALATVLTRVGGSV